MRAVLCLCALTAVRSISHNHDDARRRALVINGCRRLPAAPGGRRLLPRRQRRHDVIACDTRQAAQHSGEALKAAVLTGERRCVIVCRVDTFDSCSRRFAADDTARWIRRCANEVAFFFETCTLLYPQAASGAAPTAAGLPVEPLLRKWGRVMDGSEDHGLTPTDCFFVVSPSTFDELVALRRLYRAAMAARALVVVVNHGFETPPPELDEASEVYRLQPLDIEEPSTGKVARVCVSRRFPTDYEVFAARGSQTCA